MEVSEAWEGVRRRMMHGKRSDEVVVEGRERRREEKVSEEGNYVFNEEEREREGY